jgi:hypothetical protein
MTRNTTGLSEHLRKKTGNTLEKVDDAIRELALNEKRINFNSVSNLSGVSKTFLYNNLEVKTRIEELREKQINKNINQRAKYDKTSKSKDVIIQAKDKKISELELENARLKAELEVLRGKIYEQM